MAKDKKPSVAVPSLTRPEDHQLLGLAFCAALVIHALALLISFPDAPTQAPRQGHYTAITVKRYIPPPPRIEQPRVATTTKKHARKIPVPDPTPDALEPVREPELEIALSPILGDVDILIGDPTPPGPIGPPGFPGSTASDGPVLAGVGGITVPVRIEESYVQPEYPEIARAARVESSVILQAVIFGDGTVGEARAMRCTEPGFGFEEAAIAAVRQWRYEPATQSGQPVSVYFTILVDFELTWARTS